MALMAVTCTSAGRQSWKERSLFDVTVISSFVTEFIFISQSEAGLNFLIWREVPSILLTSTLHDTTEKKQYRKILAFHFFWSYFLILFGHVHSSWKHHSSQTCPTGILILVWLIELNMISQIVEGSIDWWYASGVIHDSAMRQSQSSPKLTPERSEKAHSPRHCFITHPHWSFLDSVTPLTAESEPLL